MYRMRDVIPELKEALFDIDQYLDSLQERERKRETANRRADAGQEEPGEAKKAKPVNTDADSQRRPDLSSARERAGDQSSEDESQPTLEEAQKAKPSALKEARPLQEAYGWSDVYEDRDGNAEGICGKLFSLYKKKGVKGYLQET